MIHWFDGEPTQTSLNGVCSENENIDENEEMVDTTEYFSESDDDDEDDTSDMTYYLIFKYIHKCHVIKRKLVT